MWNRPLQRISTHLTKGLIAFMFLLLFSLHSSSLFISLLSLCFIYQALQLLVEDIFLYISVLIIVQLITLNRFRVQRDVRTDFELVMNKAV